MQSPASVIQVDTARICSSGINNIPLLSSSIPIEWSSHWERASAFAIDAPGLWTHLKLKCDNHCAQCACLLSRSCLFFIGCFRHAPLHWEHSCCFLPASVSVSVSVVGFHFHLLSMVRGSLPRLRVILECNTGGSDQVLDVFGIQRPRQTVQASSNQWGVRMHM